ncbi:MAG TPA: M14 family metallopeptidase, partial [Blastocatellia bacterium]|nr:M14 family metallopeptidase [Blastocatellia bacterium]
APFALLIASSSLFWYASAQSPGAGRALSRDNFARAHHAELKARLVSESADQFRYGLDALSQLDEPGAHDLWQTALTHPDPRLKREAWQRYREISRELLRKEMVPKVVSAALSPDDLLALAARAGVEVNIWSSIDGRTVAAAPDYLLERLVREGTSFAVLFDSIAAWQQARAQGDQLARSVTPEYQTRSAEDRLIVRIAVIDLASSAAPAGGYSGWLGDLENVVLRNESTVAYIDVFSSDGSEDSIRSHVENRYTRRGFRLAGFYTPEEFEQVAPQFFPGQSFDPHPRSDRSPRSELQIAGAEGGFHSYEETLAEFTQLSQQHPDIARLVNLGKSYEGRDIFALKVSRNPELNDSTKPDVLITGCYHAREWISVEPPVYFANQLVKGYATDDSLKHLVDRLQIWIVPIVNPDGLVYSQGSTNDRLDSVRLWRKNRRPITADGCKSGVGVDLNRNFGFQWRLGGDEPCPNYSDDLGGSDDPENEIFRGVRAETEPEIKALKTLIDDPDRRFRAQLDYHNYSQLVLYPWGYQPFAAPDERTLSALARQISDEIFKVDRKQYQPQQAIELYATTGSSIDYSYGVNRVAAPFLIEMRPTSGSFNVPENQIEMINKENWAGARLILDWAAGPPILESVKAYQQSSDGNFTKLVYSANWSRSRDTDEQTRQLVVDTRFLGLETGRVQFRLQFSKPMNAAFNPVAKLGREPG